MIGYIKGTVEEIREDHIILDNHGIGYQIFVPGNALQGKLYRGQETKIYTWLQVREDAFVLFGFLDKDDLELFRMMIAVSGLGPKGALAILSALTADQIRFAVLAEDAAAIAKAPGIGKKTAQKLILELKDKLRMEDAFEKQLAHMAAGGEDASAAAAAVGAQAGAEADAVEALVALGYSGSEALQAVRKVQADASMDAEAILKAALKYIF